MEAKHYNALDHAEATLPIAWYYDPVHYELELSRIWYRHWIYVCRSNALDEPGSYRTLTIGRQPVFVVRDDDGGIRGYYNSCRHRGSVLLTETEGRLRSRTIACPYHRWCYAPDDGRLLGVSSFAEPEGFDKKNLGLHKVAVAEWRGCVFVNLDAGAQFGAHAFSHGYDELANFALEDLVIGDVWTKEIACNWKGFWDNYNECLHCPVVHPELIEMFPIFKRGLLDERDRPDWREHADDPDPKYRGGLREGAETFSRDGTCTGLCIYRGPGRTGPCPWCHLRGRTAIDPTSACTWTMRASFVSCRSVPNPWKCRLSGLFRKEALNDPAYDMNNVTDFVRTVLTEDAMVCELNQRGMHALPMGEGVLMPEEYDLKHFKDWLLGALDE